MHASAVSDLEGAVRQSDLVSCVTTSTALVMKGDLFDVCRGNVKGRTSADEITLFKSCGTAIEDLATAIMVYQKAA